MDSVESLKSDLDNSVQGYALLENAFICTRITAKMVQFHTHFSLSSSLSSIYFNKIVCRLLLLLLLRLTNTPRFTSKKIYFHSPSQCAVIRWKILIENQTHST